MVFLMGLLLLGAGMAHADEGTAVATLQDLENPAQIQVVRGSNTLSPQEGFELFPGDVIHVGPQASVRIQYPDESTLAVAEGSQVKIEAPVEQAPAATLDSGNVYAQIQKKLGTVDSRKLKFILRTKSVVMGVRGTEFFVGESAEGSSLHTMDGSVECAPDAARLQSGAGVAVAGGFTMNARGGVLSPVTGFDRRGFLARFAAEHPVFRRVVQRFRQRMRQRGQQRMFQRNRERNGHQGRPGHWRKATRQSNAGHRRRGQRGG